MYRFFNDNDYFDNQYQNRSFYNQRFNVLTIQQRVYLTKNDSKYYNKKKFQKKQNYYNDSDYQSQKKKRLKNFFIISINTNTNIFFTINRRITKLTTSSTRLTNQT